MSTPREDYRIHRTILKSDICWMSQCHDKDWWGRRGTIWSKEGNYISVSKPVSMYAKRVLERLHEHITSR